MVPNGGIKPFAKFVLQDKIQKLSNCGMILHRDFEWGVCDEKVWNAFVDTPEEMAAWN